MSLFTNVLIKDTIDYVCEICKKFAKHVFKKLLQKPITECTFDFKGKLHKQVDGINVGGALSVTLQLVS